MIKYSVRSRQLIDIVGDLKRNKIILSPYFQRNLVWRNIHKQDFIKTILLGFPFPQIFLAKGGIDVDELTTISMIVDGQQRMGSILEYIDNKLDVEGEFFADLTREQKDNFLTYEVAIIELQMEAADPQIKEVFKRLNRTFYSLTNIEKISTEYASSEIMLVAKILTKEIELKLPKDEHTIDPNVPEDFIKWAIRKKVDHFTRLVLDSTVFTNYEISRKVHLQIILNILGTIERGFFNRNIPASMIEEYTEDFPDKDEILNKLDKIAEKYLDANLKEGSYWLNKSNFFSLIVFFYEHFEEITSNITGIEIKRTLDKFEKNLPPEYQLASKEAVNNKKERSLRNSHLVKIFIK